MICEICGTKDLLSYSAKVLGEFEKRGIFLHELYDGDFDHCLKCGGMLIPEEDED